MRNFNFGKLLVVGKYCQLGKREIKSLTQSAVVTELKNTKAASNELRLLFNLLTHSFDLLRTVQNAQDLKLYQLDSNAVSTFYSLKDSTFIRALYINDQTYNELDAYADVVSAIQSTRRILSLNCNASTRIIRDIGSTGITTTNLVTYDDQLKSLSNCYAEETYLDARSRLIAAIDNKW